jgi:hypothetical protein
MVFFKVKKSGIFFYRDEHEGKDDCVKDFSNGYVATRV